MGILGEPKGVKTSALCFGSQDTFGTTANLNKDNLGVGTARNRTDVRRGFSLGPSARFARSRILSYSPQPRARKALTKARGLSRKAFTSSWDSEGEKGDSPDESSKSVLGLNSGS